MDGKVEEMRWERFRKWLRLQPGRAWYGLRHNWLRVIVLILFAFVGTNGFLLSRTDANGKPLYNLAWPTGDVWRDLLVAFGPELAGIAIGFLALDWFNERRQVRQFREQLIRELGGNDNALARRALRELRAHGGNPPDDSWLTDGSLEEAHLWRANLGDAELRHANLERADLGNANLEGAELEYAKLQRAGLAHANLQGAGLANANLQGTYLGSANLVRAVLADANLQGAMLDRANLQGAVLWDANLQGADLAETDLRGSGLWRANLQGADLVGTDLRGAGLNSADLRDAVLEGADLERANLTRADLEGADLFMANLQDTQYDGNTRWPDGFDPVAAGAVNIDETPEELDTPPPAEEIEVMHAERQRRGE